MFTSPDRVERTWEPEDGEGKGSCAILSSRHDMAVVHVILKKSNITWENKRLFNIEK